MSDSSTDRRWRPFLAEVEKLRPAGAEVIDAHTHLGLDEDGRSLTLEQLLGQLDAAGATRACVFPLHDPERGPSYSLPNDRVLAWARRERGAADPVLPPGPRGRPGGGGRTLPGGRRARASSCIRGPRTSTSTARRWQGVFELAEDAKVPILIHAGRGLPPLADGLGDLALRHPGAVLILAHGAICDQGILTTRLADHPGVLYDISCFFPLDVIELLARVPAERVVFASDPPYGMPATTLYMALRVAPQAGLDEATTRALLGGTMASLLDGEELPAVSEPEARPARSRSRGAWRGCTATRAWWDRRCSRALGAGEGDARHGDRLLPRPRAGRRGRGAGDDRLGAGGGGRAARQRGGRAPGDRPRLPLQRAALRRSSPGLDSDGVEPDGCPARPRLARRSRSRIPRRPWKARTTCRPRRSSRPAGDQVPRWLGERRGELEEQRLQEVGDHDAAARARVEGAAARRSRRSAWRTSSSTPLTVAFGARGRDALGVVVETRARARSRARAATIASTPEPQPTSSTGPGGLDAGGELEQQLQAQPRGGVPARAERLAGVDHDLLEVAGRMASAGSHGGRTRIAGTGMRAGAGTAAGR